MTHITETIAQLNARLAAGDTTREALVAKAIDRAALQDIGLKPEWPPEWEGFDRIPVVQSPEQIWIVVAGSGGPQSQVAIPWMSRACWTTVQVRR